MAPSSSLAATRCPPCWTAAWSVRRRTSPASTRSVSGPRASKVRKPSPHQPQQLQAELAGFQRLLPGPARVLLTSTPPDLLSNASRRFALVVRRRGRQHRGPLDRPTYPSAERERHQLREHQLPQCGHLWERRLLRSAQRRQSGARNQLWEPVLRIDRSSRPRQRPPRACQQLML
jgi:hypothetical protein